MNFLQRWFVTDKVKTQMIAEAKEELRAEVKAEIYDEVVEEIIADVREEERIKIDESQKTTLTLMFDDDMKVVPKTNINPRIVQTLLDQEYLPPELAEDREGVQFALILAGSEVLDQIIDDANEVARALHEPSD